MLAKKPMLTAISSALMSNMMVLLLLFHTPTGFWLSFDIVLWSFILLMNVLSLVTIYLAND